MRRSLLAGMLMASLTASAVLAATPTKLIDTDAHTTTGDREIGWTAWSQFQRGRWVGYVQPDDGARQKIPVPGNTLIGSILVDGPRSGQVVFENEGGIGFYDLEEGELRNAPQGVNTSKFETNVSGSGDYLLFGRGRRDEGFSRQVVLFRISTQRGRILDAADAGVLGADEVNGDYAVWTACGSSTCRIHRFRISTRGEQLVPKPGRGRAHYWAGVLPDGTVYHVDGGYRACGRNTRIRRWDGDSSATITTVPDNWEIVDIHPWSDGADNRLVYARTHCSRFDIDLFEVLDDVD